MPANLNRKQQREIKAVVERAKKDNGIPQTAQQSIPFQRMFPDGICRVTDSYYTKTIQFQDINYQLAQQEDKTAIFDEWCSFLNFFDSSIHFELSFMNLSTDAESFEKSIRIPFKKDSFNPVRAEYSQMLKKQLAQGNNGLTKTKYLTFGIEAESMRQAKPRLNHIENDLLNNFRRLGVIATTMNGKERLHLMHSMFHMGDNDKFFFDWKYLVESGLSVKDFIAPTAFAFKTNRTFQMGSIFGSMSYLAITASDLSDRMLADFLDMESTQIVTMHIQSVDQTAAIKTIIFIDFMDLAYEEIKEYHALHAYVEEHYQEGKTNYLFVDEVQMCPKFELAINSLYSKGKYDIYVTGSNAFLLSADLATLFTGRYIEIHVFPFSFQEYCQYYDDISDKDKLFDEYAIKGGLAGSYAYRTEKDRTNYIKEVYETIVTRDLVQKYTLPDTLVLQRLSEFLMDNISNLTSPNKVSQLLTANETPTNHVTVGKYIKYLCNAFVFYDIKRYDIRGKKYLESSEKFYLCDSGIRYAILGSRNIDYGRVYENVVCIELLRRGYDVYVGKLYQKEIDFVAQRGSEKIYIQVSDNISGQETFERECSPLLQIRDAYPKMIIARTKHPQYSYEGIEIHDIADWLLQE